MPVEVMQGNRFGRVSGSEHSFAYVPENIGSVVISSDRNGFIPAERRSAA